jgi:hypothetical protein
LPAWALVKFREENEDEDEDDVYSLSSDTDAPPFLAPRTVDLLTEMLMKKRPLMRSLRTMRT